MSKFTSQRQPETQIRFSNLSNMEANLERLRSKWYSSYQALTSLPSSLTAWTSKTTQMVKSSSRSTSWTPARRSARSSMKTASSSKKIVRSISQSTTSQKSWLSLNSKTGHMFILEEDRSHSMETHTAYMRSSKIKWAYLRSTSAKSSMKQARQMLKSGKSRVLISSQVTQVWLRSVNASMWSSAS